MFCSYKISIPAADLQKALVPSIWQLREFIWYARKNTRHQQIGGGLGAGRVALGRGIDTQAAASQHADKGGRSNQVQSQQHV